MVNVRLTVRSKRLRFCDPTTTVISLPSGTLAFCSTSNLTSCHAHEHLQLQEHAGMNTLHRYYVTSIGYRFANVFIWSWLGSYLAGLAPPYLADDCRLVSLTDRHLRSANIRTCIVPEQTLGSGIQVSQPLVQKYGTVCCRHSDSLA